MRAISATSAHTFADRSRPAFRKDATLDELARSLNVAQFVSFSPSDVGPRQEYCRVAGWPPNQRFESNRQAIELLLERSGERKVNLRTFNAEHSQSSTFIYGIDNPQEVEQRLNEHSAAGLFVIANETVNTSDGGVSGVAMGDVVEFRPDSTPRGVERPGFAALPRTWASSLLKLVYGFDPGLDLAGRVEFSVHPMPRGWKQEHVIFWELGSSNETNVAASVSWPNDFSRMVGDKVYGLLVADVIGLPVPHTTVINRRVAPFSFGKPTGSFERWLRTSPVEQVPGRFSTTHGWIDPFLLLAKEDPNHSDIASVLAQDAVQSVWSGAVVETSAGGIIVEGVAGSGDQFMLGSVQPEPLPNEVEAAVRDLHEICRSALGATRFEWAFDGHQVWILQLHVGSTNSTATTIVPGDASEWLRFDVALGLEELRARVRNLPADTGLILSGGVGLTSHVADVLRKAGVPSRVTN